MSTSYVGIHAATVRNVVEAAHKLLRERDLSHWKRFCDRLAGVSMFPTLTLDNRILGIPGPSLMQVDDLGGFPALSPSEVPDLDDPGFGWVIRTLLENSSALRARGRFDGLRGTLLDGLNRTEFLESETEIEVYDRFVETIFNTPADLPEEQMFMAVADGFWSVTAPAELDSLLSADSKNTLQTIVSRLLAAPVASNVQVGRELLRVIRIGQLALIDDLDLWAYEND